MAYDYTKPTLTQDGGLEITGGRHPVVERLLDEKAFVPNDTSMHSERQLIVITGPNMAGKSVYMRQVALIVLLAHIGCFVPAEAARISLVDRIFVRSGAADVITAGLSTFMVEMVETAYILRHATNNSLVVMDEIGRGTSTYDGISIAWAVAEELVQASGAKPKTLFATHYHELQALAEEYPQQIHNAHMAIEEHKAEPIFLYQFMPGPASHSYGVAVAQLAGVPDGVTKPARLLLKQLEQQKPTPEETGAVLLQEVQESAMSLWQQFQQANLDELSPKEALELLYKWKQGQ